MQGLATEVVAGLFVVEPNLQRSLENPNLPLNDPKIWDEVLGSSFRTNTGETLTHDKSLSYAPVWQAVSLISGDVAKLPLMLYKQRRDGVRQEVEDDPLTELVQLTPNKESHAFKFWRRVMVHALVWNNAYIYILRNELDEPVELLHLLPDRTNMERHDGELWCITELTLPDGVGRQLKAIPARDVLHIEGISLDCVEGRDLVHAARNSWALGLAQEKFASVFFKHGGRIGGILEVPAGVSKQAKDAIEDGFRKSYEGTDNPFRTVILRDNAKFHAAQQSPAEAQMVEASEHQVRQVARWFNLSPSKLGLSDSVSYNSKAEDNQAYLDTTLSHWLKPIAMECTIKLLTEKQRRKMWFEHDTTELLRMNPTQRADFYQKMIASMVLSPNDARRMENWEPYEGGDRYVNPNNTAPDGGKTEQEPPENDAISDDNPPDRSKIHDLARVVFHIGSNARYKASRPSAFIEWVDGGLQSHRSEARDLLGDDSRVQIILNDLKRLAETCSDDKLPGAVNDLMAQYERNSLWNDAITSTGA